MTFSSEPLTQALDLLVFSEVLLYLQASAPVAHVVVRLTDVAPDGTSAQVCAGVLNLTHRHSHRDPKPIDPDEIMAVQLKLRAACYRFAPGHRIRVSVASAYWPVIWPSPYLGMNQLHCGATTPSQIRLPLLDAQARMTPPAMKTTAPELIEVGSYQAVEPVWQMMEDVIAGTRHVHIYDGDEQWLPNGDRIFTAERLQMRVNERNSADVRFTSAVVYRLQTENHLIAVQADMVIQSDQTHFHTDIALQVTLDENPFFERNWRESIERQLC